VAIKVFVSTIKEMKECFTVVQRNVSRCTRRKDEAESYMNNEVPREVKDLLEKYVEIAHEAELRILPPKRKINEIN
jgi:hypothetical protein